MCIGPDTKKLHASLISPSAASFLPLARETSLLLKPHEIKFGPPR